MWKNGSMQQAAVVLSQSVSWNAYTGAPPGSFKAHDLKSARGSPSVNENQSSLIHAQETCQYQAISIPASTIEAVRSGLQRLIIWGYIEYVDFPKREEQHNSEFTREMVIVDSAIDDQGTIQVSAVFRAFDPYNTGASLVQPVNDKNIVRSR